MKDEAKHQEQQHAPNPDMRRSKTHTGEPAAPASAAAIAAIFNVVADPARFPVHVREDAIQGPTSPRSIFAWRAAAVRTMLSTMHGHLTEYRYRAAGGLLMARITQRRSACSALEQEI